MIVNERIAIVLAVNQSPLNFLQSVGSRNSTSIYPYCQKPINGGPFQVLYPAKRRDLYSAGWILVETEEKQVQETESSPDPCSSSLRFGFACNLLYDSGRWICTGFQMRNWSKISTYLRVVSTDRVIYILTCFDFRVGGWAAFQQSL